MVAASRARSARWTFGLLLASLGPLAAQAQMVKDLAPEERGHWYLQTSLFTSHFSYDTRHQNRNALVNLEYQRADGWLAGGAIFKNSFDQPSQTLYIGKMWRPFTSYPSIHVKVVGGLIHGYKGEFRDKIPFNGSGIAPLLLPSIGWSNRRFGSEIILFGTAGLMWTAGVYLD